MKENTKNTEYRYSILCISGQYFGIEVKYVKEVLLLPVITQIPNVNRAILGVFNLRGQIQSVIDIRDVLNLPSEKIDEEHFVVILDFNKIILSVVVEKVLDVIGIDSSLIQIPTREMPLSLVNYSNGYYEHKNLGTVFLLDLESIFNAKEIGSYSFLGA